MDLNKVISTAKSLELAKPEVKLMKEHKTWTSAEEAAIDALHKKPFNAEKSKYEETLPSQCCSRNTFEVCRYCGERTPHVGKCKARNATCNHCHKRGHFERVCEFKNKKVDIDNISSNNQTPKQQEDNKSPPIIVLDKVRSEERKVHCVFLVIRIAQISSKGG